MLVRAVLYIADFFCCIEWGDSNGMDCHISTDDTDGGRYVGRDDSTLLKGVLVSTCENRDVEVHSLSRSYSWVICSTARLIGSHCGCCAVPSSSQSSHIVIGARSSNVRRYMPVGSDKLALCDDAQRYTVASVRDGLCSAQWKHDPEIRPHISQRSGGFVAGSHPQ